jgi:hypothetical protein
LDATVALTKKCGAFAHLGQVASALVCNLLFRSHENIISRVFPWLMAGFGKVFLEILAFPAR